MLKSERRLFHSASKMPVSEVNSSQINIVTGIQSQTSEVAFSGNPRYPQYIAVAAVAVAGFSVGNVIGWSSPGLPSMLESETFQYITTTDTALIGSLITEFAVTLSLGSVKIDVAQVGAVLGSIAGGYSIEKFGRKNTLILAAIPIALGWLLIAAATKVSMLFAGRCFTGFGIGVLCLASSVYTSEFLQPEIRGSLGSVFYVIAKFGIFITFIVGSYLPYNYLSAVCLPIPILFAVFIACLPESPRYLLLDGDTKAATDALCWFRAAKITHPTEEIMQEINEMLEEINRKRMEKVKIMDLLTLRPFLIVVGLMFFNQFCGGNAFGFYTVMIFQQTGSGLDSHLSGVIVGFVQMLAGIFSCFCLDTMGRRMVIMTALFIMFVSLTTLGVFFHLKSANILAGEGYVWLPLILLVVYNAAYNGGLTGPVWTVGSEILPGNVIGPACGLASTINWLMAFVITRYYLDVNELLGQPNTFLLFAVVCAFGIIFTGLFVPETKLKSLAKIQQEADRRHVGLK